MDVGQNSFHFVIEPIQVYGSMRVFELIIVMLLLVTFDTIQ